MDKRDEATARRAVGEGTGQPGVVSTALGAATGTSRAPLPAPSETLRVPTDGSVNLEGMLKASFSPDTSWLNTSNPAPTEAGTRVSCPEMAATCGLATLAQPGAAVHLSVQISPPPPLPRPSSSLSQTAATPIESPVDAAVGATTLSKHSADVTDDDSVNSVHKCIRSLTYNSYCSAFDERQDSGLCPPTVVSGQQQQVTARTVSDAAEGLVPGKTASVGLDELLVAAESADTRWLQARLSAPVSEEAFAESPPTAASGQQQQAMSDAAEGPNMTASVGLEGVLAAAESADTRWLQTQLSTRVSEEASAESPGVPASGDTAGGAVLFATVWPTSEPLHKRTDRPKGEDATGEHAEGHISSGAAQQASSAPSASTGPLGVRAVGMAAAASVSPAEENRKEVFETLSLDDLDPTRACSPGSPAAAPSAGAVGATCDDRDSASSAPEGPTDASRRPEGPGASGLSPPETPRGAQAAAAIDSLEAFAAAEPLTDGRATCDDHTTDFSGDAVASSSVLLSMADGPEVIGPEGPGTSELPISETTRGWQANDSLAAAGTDAAEPQSDCRAACDDKTDITAAAVAASAVLLSTVDGPEATGPEEPETSELSPPETTRMEKTDAASDSLAAAYTDAAEPPTDGGAACDDTSDFAASAVVGSSVFLSTEDSPNANDSEEPEPSWLAYPSATRVGEPVAASDSLAAACTDAAESLSDGGAACEGRTDLTAAASVAATSVLLNTADGPKATGPEQAETLWLSPPATTRGGQPVAASGSLAAAGTDAAESLSDGGAACVNTSGTGYIPAAAVAASAVLLSTAESLAVTHQPDRTQPSELSPPDTTRGRETIAARDSLAVAGTDTAEPLAEGGAACDDDTTDDTAAAAVAASAVFLSTTDEPEATALEEQGISELSPPETKRREQAIDSLAAAGTDAAEPLSDSGADCDDASDFNAAAAVASSSVLLSTTDVSEATGPEEPGDLSITWDGSFGDMVGEEMGEADCAEAGPPRGAWRRRSVADGYAGKAMERTTLTKENLKARLDNVRRRTAESVAQKARQEGGDVTADDVMEGGESMMQQLLWVMEKLQDELVEEEEVKRQAMGITTQYKNSVELLERRVPQLRDELEQCNVRLIELSERLDECVASRSQKDDVIASTDVAIMQVHEQMDKVEARRLAEGHGAAKASPQMDRRTIEDAEKDFRQLKVRFYELSNLRTRNAEKALRASGAGSSGSPSFRKLPLRLIIPHEQADGNGAPPETPSTPMPLLLGAPSPTVVRKVSSAPEEEASAAAGMKASWIGKFGRGIANRLWNSNPPSKETSPKAADNDFRERPKLPQAPSD